MSRRARHTPEQIVRKLRQADELAAEGKTTDEIARQLNVSTATLENLILKDVAEGKF